MNKDLLSRKWIRSYNEGSEDEIVFHSETPDLRRGGDAIDLKNDGSFEHQQSGADDRYDRIDGKWNLGNDNVLSFGQNSVFGSNQHQIVSVSNDKLVLKKI